MPPFSSPPPKQLTCHILHVPLVAAAKLFQDQDVHVSLVVVLASYISSRGVQQVTLLFYEKAEKCTNKAVSFVGSTELILLTNVPILN